ncbi:MAG: sigma-70 family RNA polymerase sigma factor [Gemmataceae bacterium]
MSRTLLALLRQSAILPPTTPDAALVQQTVAGDSAALAQLIARHGPMVWAVCRNLLPEADAEDAFQATFLVLVKRGKSIRQPERLGAWLHGAALRVARQARRQNARQRKREAAAARPEGQETPAPPPDWADLQAEIHAEVDRLGPRERSVFVLCSLEGASQADAAAQLGLKLNSVSGLLARARQKILARLQARGLAPVLAATGLAIVTPRVPATLVATTQTLCAPGAIVPPTVLLLTRTATESLVMKSIWTSGLILAGALATGGGVVWSQSASTAIAPPATAGLPQSRDVPRSDDDVGALDRLQEIISEAVAEDGKAEKSTYGFAEANIRSAEDVKGILKKHEQLGYYYCGSEEIPNSKTNIGTRLFIFRKMPSPVTYRAVNDSLPTNKRVPSAEPLLGSSTVRPSKAVPTPMPIPNTIPAPISSLPTGVVPPADNDPFLGSPTPVESKLAAPRVMDERPPAPAYPTIAPVEVPLKPPQPAPRPMIPQVPAAKQLVAITLKNATSQQVTEAYSTLLSESMPDLRISTAGANQILLYGTDADISKLKKLAELIDVPGAAPKPLSPAAAFTR